MYYVCEKYYKPITVQHYITNYVSWVPRIASWTQQTKLGLQMHSWNGTHLGIGDLLYV